MPRKASSSCTPPKRRRASKPKVTTGCLTCKIRHVKCDEGKPHCRRCLTTGRTCDGYSLPRSPYRSPTYHSSNPSSILTILPGTVSERHSFSFFHSHTSPQLGGLFSSPFWSQDVLQASLREEAIWHAAVALGSMHSSFSNDKTKGSLVSEFAVQQYIKAIGCLTRPNTERRVDVALMACLLFTCFESLRGHHSPALLHLDNGINLLLELQPLSETKPSLTALIYPTTPYTPLPALQAILTRLDTQATQLIPSRRTRLRPISAPPTDYGVFSSLEEAQMASDELWNYCLYTLQPSSSSSLPLSQHQSPHQHQQQYQHQHLSPSQMRADLAHLQFCYTTALSAFLSAYPAKTARERKAGDLLRLHALVATLSLSPASLSEYEEVWEGYTHDFAAIVSLARSIIEADDTTGGGGIGSLSLDTGVLGPLYLVAIRCRDPVVRREAVDLLGREGRKEGLWDSTLLSRVAERVVGIEEDNAGMYGGGKEGDRVRGRVADVDVIFDPEGCRAGVRFLMEGSGVAVGG